jgi:Holliday junction resolvase
MTKRSGRKERTSALTKAVIDLCFAYGGYAWRNNNQPRIAANGKAFFPDKKACGSPDVIAAMPHGVTLWIEVKVSPDKMHESQYAFEIQLTQRGHLYMLVKDDVSILQTWLENFSGKPSFATLQKRFSKTE